MSLDDESCFADFLYNRSKYVVTHPDFTAIVIPRSFLSVCLEMVSPQSIIQFNGMSNTIEAKMRTVALNIRKVREYRDYTQEYLAMKLGISQNAYSKIELAYTRITLERLIQIAQILEVDSVDLLNGNSEDLIRLHTSK